MNIRLERIKATAAMVNNQAEKLKSMPGSRAVNLAITKLEEAKMWLDTKLLDLRNAGAVDQPTPAATSA